MRAVVAIILLLALGGCAGEVPAPDQPTMYLNMANGGAKLDPQAAASMISLYRQNNGLGGVAVDPSHPGGSVFGLARLAPAPGEYAEKRCHKIRHRGELCSEYQIQGILDAHSGIGRAAINWA